MICLNSAGSLARSEVESNWVRLESSSCTVQRSQEPLPRGRGRACGHQPRPCYGLSTASARVRRPLGQERLYRPWTCVCTRLKKPSSDKSPSPRRSRLPERRPVYRAETSTDFHPLVPPHQKPLPAASRGHGRGKAGPMGEACRYLDEINVRS